MTKNNERGWKSDGRIVCSSGPDCSIDWDAKASIGDGPVYFECVLDLGCFLASCDRQDSRKFLREG